MLPGVARVVHSKASCTVHWLESGKGRPGSKELPAVQILGMHAAPLPRGGAKSGRGSGVAAATASTSAPASGDTRRAEPPTPDPPPDNTARAEENKDPSVPPPPSSSQQALASKAEGSAGLPEGGAGGTDASGVATGTKSKEKQCGGAGGSSDQCREEQAGTSSPETKLPVTGSEEASLQASASPEAKDRAAERIREEGWSARRSENVTLAELYLMLGKPSKLQLEYEWQPTAAPPPSSQENGQAPAHPHPVPCPPSSMHRVLRCLLRLVATEVNPKPLVGTLST